MVKIHVRIIDIQQKIKKMDNKIIKEGTLLETQAIIFRCQRKIKYFHNQRKIAFLNKCSNNTISDKKFHKNKNKYKIQKVIPHISRN